MNKFLTFIIILCVLGCKTPEARRPVSVKTGSFIDDSVERNKQLNANEQSKIEKVMKSYPDQDFIASESGFWYYYNIKSTIDTLPTPEFGDIIDYNYNVKNLDGVMIYSKEELSSQTYAMDQQELFTGLREGLKLMKEGETVTFLFPSQKAFGYYGDENKIGRSTPIICEVTVLSIKTNEDN